MKPVLTLHDKLTKHHTNENFLSIQLPVRVCFVSKTIKQIIPLFFLFFSLISFGQAKTDKMNILVTTKYSGFYSYGEDIEKGRVGSIIIYPETDSTILFYNMFQYNFLFLLFRTTSPYYKKDTYSDKSCKWLFNFTKNSLTIKTINEQNDCGFGNAVYVDGVFKRQSYKTKDYFEGMVGEKTYFKKTKPEDYYKF